MCWNVIDKSMDGKMVTMKIFIYKVQEELDRIECDDEQQRERQQESRHPIESHNAVHVDVD